MARKYADVYYKDGALYWSNGPFAGKIAGTRRVDGYIKLCYRGKQWLAHKLIWKLVYGEEPTFIDHKNGERSDNRLENLRVCSKQSNAANYKPKVKFRGVSKHQGAYRAYINFNDKFIHLASNCTELEAAMIYNINAERLFGEFAYYNKVFEDVEE